MDPKDKVRTFVVTNFYVSDPSMLRDEDSLLEMGIIDSTGVLELIAFLETEMGVQVADADMTPDNLGSIARIAAFVETKRGNAVDTKKIA